MRKIIYGLLILIGAWLLMIVVVPRPKLSQLQSVNLASNAMAPKFFRDDTVHIRPTASKAEPFARGDVILFERPEDPSSIYLARIVAIPGDLFEMRDRKIFISHKEVVTSALPLSECGEERLKKEYPDVRFVCVREILDSIQFKTLWNESPSFDETVAKIYVPQDKYYVLGDNRSRSVDSRSLGLIARSAISGKIVEVATARNNSSFLRGLLCPDNLNERFKTLYVKGIPLSVCSDDK